MAIRRGKQRLEWRDGDTNPGALGGQRLVKVRKLFPRVLRAQVAL